MIEKCRTMLSNLLPRGPAWPRRRDSAMQELLAGLAVELCRVEARVTDLHNEAQPLQTTEMISDWERAYGLPEKCFPAVMTLEQRRRAVRTKMSSVGRADPSYFEEMLEKLGFRAIVERTVPGRPHYWRINLPAIAERDVRHFRAGRSHAGDRLREWDALSKAGECVINIYKPLHTRVEYEYDL